MFTLFLLINSCKKEFYDAEKIDPIQSAKIKDYLKEPKIETVSFSSFTKDVNMATLGTLKEVMLNTYKPQTGKSMASETVGAKPRYKVNVDSAKLLVVNGQSNYIFSIDPVSPRAVTFRNLTINKKGATVSAYLTTYTPTRKWARNYMLGKKEKFQGKIDLMPINLNDNDVLTIGHIPVTVLPKTATGQKTMQVIPKTSNILDDCNAIPIYGQEPYYCASGIHGPGDICALTGDDRAGYITVVVSIRYECSGGGGDNGGGGTIPNPPGNYNPCDEPEQEGGPRENQIPNMEDDQPLCGGVENQPSTPRDTIMTDNFVKNIKAMCVLAKLMNNSFYKNTLNNFIGVNKPIDLTFKLESISTTGYINYGQTIPAPLTWNAQNIDLTLNADIIDSLPSIQVAFTLLHEGIHAEIYRKLLSIHGPANLNGLNFPSMFNLYQQYKISQGFSHEYMANYYVDIISNAIKQYDNNQFDLDYYKALAWNGLEETNYYKNNLTQTQKTDITNKLNSLLTNRSKEACNDL